MTNLHTNGLTLDRGIEGVSHRGRDADNNDLWPDQQSLPPPSQIVRAQVAELLSSPDTTGYLKAALQPTISNPELLTPSRFHTTLSNALTDLRDVVDAKHENSRIFNRAIRLIAEEIGLRELTHMYRSTLYQG